MGIYSRRILLSLAGLLCLLSLSLGTKPRLEDDHDDLNPKGLSIDQVILNAARNARDPEDDSKPAPSSPDGHFIRRELDMLFTLEQIQAMNHMKRQKRTAAVRYYYSPRWTNNVVNYELQQGTFTSRDQVEIRKAIDEIKHYTCLTFEQTSTAQNRVLLQAGRGGCYSNVGMIGGVQPLGLASGCRSKTTIIHEFLHAIGIHHEQTRPDRDDHVTIALENIQDSVEYNFKKNEWYYINDFGHPYDYMSVMHYGKTAFSINGKNSIVTKDPKYQNDIGNNPGLSFGDIWTLNHMHSCAPNTCPLRNRDCGAGFVGKDCKCWCQGPDKNHPAEYCFEEDRREKGSLDFTAHICMDYNSNCASYVKSGYCLTEARYMKYNCDRSCNFC